MWKVELHLLKKLSTKPDFIQTDTYIQYKNSTTVLFKWTPNDLYNYH